MLRRWAPLSGILAALAWGAAVEAEPRGENDATLIQDAGTRRKKSVPADPLAALSEAVEVATGGRVDLSGYATIDEFVATLDDLELSDPLASVASSTAVGISDSGRWYAGAVYLAAVPASVGCSTRLTPRQPTGITAFPQRSIGCGSFSPTLRGRSAREQYLRAVGWLGWQPDVVEEMGAMRNETGHEQPTSPVPRRVLDHLMAPGPTEAGDGRND